MTNKPEDIGHEGTERERVWIYLLNKETTLLDSINNAAVTDVASLKMYDANRVDPQPNSHFFGFGFVPFCHYFGPTPEYGNVDAEHHCS